jgi:hypothetical protein
MTNNEPIFILALPRSFTSLVNAVLGQHPQLYGLPELNLFLAETMAEFWTGKSGDGKKKSVHWPVMRHGLLRTVAHLYGGEQTVNAISMAFRWIMVRRERTTAEVYQELCERIAPLTPVEKSPAYIAKPEYLHRIARAFPRARYIHLLRHPRGQGESVLNARGGSQMLMMAGSLDFSGEEVVVDPQVAWRKGNLQIAEFLDQIPAARWIRLRGEDLISDLDGQLAELCGWLGLPAGGDDLEAMRHPEDSPYACVGPVNARLGNDINFLNAPAIRPFKVKTYDMAEPLPWRPDGRPFSAGVTELAREYGYR